MLRLPLQGIGVIKKDIQDSRMPFRDENTLTYDELPCDWQGENLY